MFRFADKGVVWWPVTLRQGTPEGTVEEVEVRLAYRLLDRKALRARERELMGKIAGNLTGDGTKVRSVDDLLQAVDDALTREDEGVALLLDHVSDWRGIADGDTPMQFSRERLAALLEYDVYFKPVMAGLHEASRAGPAKNSSPGLAGMPARVQA